MNCQDVWGQKQDADDEMKERACGQDCVLPSGAGKAGRETRGGR